LSIKPEILFLRAVSETSLKACLTHSPVSGVKGRTLVEGCQGAHSFFLADFNGLRRGLTVATDTSFRIVRPLTGEAAFTLLPADA
jgi:hypothetical protein